MRLSDRVKPISYVKANASEILDDLAETREPMAITRNGEVKAIVQDIVSYEETQETLTFLKILTLSLQEVEDGHTEPARDAIEAMLAETV